MRFIIVLAILAVRGTAASVCSPEEESFKFTVRSKRNSTRHRLVEVDVASNAPPSSSDDGDMTLDVSHSRSVCSKGEVVHLRTAVVVLEILPRRDDYELFPGIGYYKIHTTAQLWEDARETCISEGAHLIVLNSDTEAEVVKEFFSRKPTVTGADTASYIFGGFHDKYSEGNFVTVTGVALSKSGYIKWDRGEPNGKSERQFGGINSNGLLHDIPNSWKLSFVCEQEL